MDLQQLSRQELIALVKALMRKTRKLKRELGYELSEKLSEMFKPPAKNEEPKKPGAKNGHEGVTRPMPERVDEQKKLALRRCPKGHRLTKIRETKSRTIEDIELVRRTKVVEYELQGYWCGTCRRKVFPKVFDAMPRFRFGMNFCNYVCERRFTYRMSINLIQFDLLENFGLQVSQASIVNCIHAVANLLGEKYELYKQFLREGKFVHIDESGWRVAGTNVWLWKFRSADTVVTVIDERRSHDVPEGVLGDYEGTAIVDGFSAYNLLDCEKQRCWAHILRHAKNALEKYPTRGTERFCRALQRLYHDAKHAQKSAYARRRFESRLRRLLHIRHIRSRNPDILRLRKFLAKHFDELFVFLEKDVDGTNNAAEQAIRKDVVMRKISGGNRSWKGSRDYEVISSVVQTCKLRNENFSDIVLDELKATACG